LSNTHTVQQIYEAFGRGDVPGILDKLDDSIEWETPGPRAGRALAAVHTRSAYSP
jgi:ketosteroid isomerase-like protein